MAKKLARLDTTVSYCWEGKDMNVLKDPAMLKRLNDIQGFSEQEPEDILYTVDALIKNLKFKAIAE